MEGAFSTSSRTDSLTKTGVSSGLWQSNYGCSQGAFFKPFSTNVLVSGVPHYQLPIGFAVSGKAVSTGLNPFGPWTLGEGIIWGTGVPANLDIDIDAANTRPLGLKTPVTLVGWGWDTHGFAAPNACSGYRSSGVYQLGTAVEPSGAFHGYGTGVSIHGSGVPPHRWLAGPLDVQWDVLRRVWTCDNGIYPAKIFATHCSGGVSELLPQFAERVTYSARTINQARLIEVTGVTPIDQRPAVGTYMIQPLVSGNYCEIVADVTGNMPRYSLVVRERFAPSGC